MKRFEDLFSSTAQEEAGANSLEQTIDETIDQIVRRQKGDSFDRLTTRIEIKTWGAAAPHRIGPKTWHAVAAKYRRNGWGVTFEERGPDTFIILSP